MVGGERNFFEHLGSQLTIEMEMTISEWGAAS
jgi:hypothetical protein